MQRPAKKHELPDPLICKICEKRFEKRKDLSKHLTRFHKLNFTERLAQLPPRVFANKPRFRCRFTKFSEHQCRICYLYLSTAATLRIHLERHNDDDHHECESCGFVASTGGGLKDHVARSHRDDETKIVTCGKCSQQFKNRGRMTRHWQSVHEEGPMLHCEYCDFTTKLKKDLTRHQKRHFEEQRFPCDLCNYVGKNNRLLNGHKQRVHTDAKPYNCTVCDYL